VICHAISLSISLEPTLYVLRVNDSQETFHFHIPVVVKKKSCWFVVSKKKCFHIVYPSMHACIKYHTSHSSHLTSDSPTSDSDSSAYTTQNTTADSILPTESYCSPHSTYSAPCNPNRNPRPPDTKGCYCCSSASTPAQACPCLRSAEM
jgi:hypothetical protein